VRKGVKEGIRVAASFRKGSGEDKNSTSVGITEVKDSPARVGGLGEGLAS